MADTRAGNRPEATPWPGGPHPTAFHDAFAGSARARVLLDDGFRVLDANPAYLRTTGLRREELVGREVCSAMSDATTWATGQARVLQASMRRALAGGGRDEVTGLLWDGPARRGRDARMWDVVTTAVTVVGPSSRFLVQEIADVTAPVVSELTAALTVGTARRRWDDGGSHRDDRRQARDTARTVAHGLQHVLTPRLPTVPGLELASCSLTATAGDTVGGDWFDVVEPAPSRDGRATGRDGRTWHRVATAVVGDVAGHDVAAAGTMGQLRGVVRAFLRTTGDGPAGTLRLVDHAARDLEIGTTATAVVAALDRVPDQVSGAAWRLTWSSAGHPPPIAILPTGLVLVLTARRPDLLLGVDPGTTRREHRLALPAGTTVLLHTNGLVENRTVDAESGTRRLLVTLQQLHSAPVTELLDAVVKDRRGYACDDDIAVLAVRVGQ